MTIQFRGPTIYGTYLAVFVRKPTEVKFERLYYLEFVGYAMTPPVIPQENPTCDGLTVDELRIYYTTPFHTIMVEDAQ